MAVETAADQAAMLDVDNGFAEAATHINEFGVSSTVNGIFDEPYSSVNIGIGEVDFSESNPTFIGRTADFTDIRFGDRLERDSVTYIIREIMPDGTGLTELTLEKE